MNRLILIFVLCGLLLPSAYGETISRTFANGDKYVGEVNRPQFSRHSPAVFGTAFHTLPARAGY